MKDLPLPAAGLLDLDDALGWLIFQSTVKGSSDVERYSAFLVERRELRGAVGTVRALVSEHGNVLVVLDDINDLAAAQFESYFMADGGLPKTLLQRALSALSPLLDRLHRVPNCFLYLTGCSLWRPTRALAGSSSPLFDDQL